MASRTIGRLIRDLVLYSAVGLVCVGVLILVAFYGSRRGEPISPTFLNWIGVGGVMAIVYPTAIYDGRAHWSSMRLWCGLTLALLLQVGVGTILLWDAPRVSLFVWGCLLYPINMVALDRFLQWWLGGATGRRVQ